MIVGIVAGASSTQSGSTTFTAPSGTTPTYTEQDDGQTDVTWRAGAVYTGVLSTAGTTGDKDATASVSSYWLTAHIALRNAIAGEVARRSTVTFTSLPAGEYDVWLSMRSTAASLDLIRVGWALKASPTDDELTYLPDYLFDTSGGAAFTDYVDHLMGRLYVPEDHPLDTLTVAVFSRREVSSAANLRLDIVALAPAWEHAAEVISPASVASGESLVSHGEGGAVYHLDSSGDIKGVGEVLGPAPLEVVPGYQVLYLFARQSKATGYADPTREVTSAPTAAVDLTPRYRT
jgi:hypothetical protein